LHLNAHRVNRMAGRLMVLTVNKLGVGGVGEVTVGQSMGDL